MARKDLGFVELEWTCPNCKTRNPGLTKTCQSCGSPQPADVEFQSKADEQVDHRIKPRSNRQKRDRISTVDFAARAIHQMPLFVRNAAEISKKA